MEDRWYAKMLREVVKKPLKFLCWRVTDGTLFKPVKPDYKLLIGPSDDWKIVVAKPDRLATMREAHDPPLAGHSGVFKTFSRVAVKYYWPKMRADITKYVRNCEICTSYKRKQQPTIGMLSHPKPSRPWEMVSTDLMGTLQNSQW